MSKFISLYLISLCLLSVSVFECGIQTVSAGLSCKDKLGVMHSDGRAWTSGNTIYYCRNGVIYYHSFVCVSSYPCRTTYKVSFAYCKVCKTGIYKPGASCLDSKNVWHSDGRTWTDSCNLYWCKSGVIYYHPYTCSSSSPCTLIGGYACSACKVCKQT